MKKINVILASLTLFGLMTGCSGSCSGNTNTSATNETQTNVDTDTPAGITMTLKPKGEVTFAVGGNGVATIDWGDGSPVETMTLVPLEEGYDREPDHNGDVSHSYAQLAEYTIKITGENIMMLWCDELNITNLELNVTALTSFICSQNQIKTLDVSKNTKLKRLVCSDNELTALDVSKIPALQDLVCNANQLTKLDVSKNPALETLWCGGNQLTKLDVSKNPELTYLECYDNQLTSLDLSKNTKLSEINCYGCQLSVNALNTLLQSLHSNSVYNYGEEDKTISIGNNPGTKTCNRSIAQKKGWRIEEYIEE